MSFVAESGGLQFVYR